MRSAYTCNVPLVSCPRLRFARPSLTRCGCVPRKRSEEQMQTSIIECVQAVKEGEAAADMCRAVTSAFGQNEQLKQTVNMLQQQNSMLSDMLVKEQATVERAQDATDTMLAGSERMQSVILQRTRDELEDARASRERERQLLQAQKAELGRTLMREVGLINTRRILEMVEGKIRITSYKVGTVTKPGRGEVRELQWMQFLQDPKISADLQTCLSGGSGLLTQEQCMHWAKVAAAIVLAANDEVHKLDIFSTSQEGRVIIKVHDDIPHDHSEFLKCIVAEYMPYAEVERATADIELLAPIQSAKL